MAKTRAVAYIRVSTAQDAQLHSYEFQEYYWRNAFASSHDTELVGIYADKGISGHSIQKRPQFLMMMEDARVRKFDKIYTKSVSRFARNTTQLLEAVRELRDIGIEVVFENENIHSFEPTSEVRLTIAAAIAENDLTVDSERQRWSIRHRCANGWFSLGMGLFGFRKTADNELVIVPEEAAIVRYIFESYVDGGLGSKKLADALNAAGVQTRSGHPWSQNHILGLLRNEKFKGDIIMGKSVKILGECHKNLNGEYAPRYYMENTHEAIVDKDTWEAAQQIMAERGRNHCREIASHTFSGLVECGCCGKNYIHKVNNSGHKYSTDIWSCRTYLKEGRRACDNTQIKDSVLKEQFVSAYNEFLERRPQGTSMVAMQETLEGLQQQERDLAELMIQRLISREAYKEESDNVKTQIADIKNRIAERRKKRVPVTEHIPIAEFDANKAKRFLTKVIVDHFTVTFVFYNGAKISRKYTNGQPGNKVGWNKKREEA